MHEGKELYLKKEFQKENNRNNANMIILGTSGSGKSTVSKMIADALHLEYLNLDSLAKTCYLNKGVLGQLKKVFPRSVFYDDGEVNFRELGNLVFNDENKIKILESILYPVLEGKIDKLIDDSKYGCVLDGIKVHETKFFEKSILKIYVKRDLKERIDSLVKRDNITSNNAKSRDNVIDFDGIKFDLIIDNDGELEDLKNKIPFIVSCVVKNNKCLYAGSFDPLTYGHLELVRQASKDFDYVFVGIGNNPNKQRTYSKERMRDLINEVLKDEGIINAMCFCYEGYTGEAANRLNIDSLVRGIRNDEDLKSEKVIEEYNFKNYGLTTKYYEVRGLKHVSSSEARRMFKNGEDISEFVPNLIEEHMLLNDINNINKN